MMVTTELSVGCANLAFGGIWLWALTGIALDQRRAWFAHGTMLNDAE